MTPPPTQLRLPQISISLSSPVGPLVLEHDGEAVTALRFAREGGARPAGHVASDGDDLGRIALAQLAEYFAGERYVFDLPLRPAGTPFQRRVWEALRRVPFGATRSYADVAADVGSPGGARAVGQANARNPIPIVIPCHRVLAAGGGIGGYAGDWGAGEGIDRKRWLLDHEAASIPARACG